MISKFCKNIAPLFHKSTRTYYKILRDVEVNETPVPIYTASKFSALEKLESTENFIDTIYQDKYLHQRYLKLVPFFLENISGIHKKHYVIKMGLLEKAESIRVTCLTNGGVINKNVSLANLIPTPFHDFLHANRRKLLEMPLFLDPEMIYYNVHEEEFYVFDKEGQWHEEGVNHPSLDITQRYNETKWFDTLRIH